MKFEEKPRIVENFDNHIVFAVDDNRLEKLGQIFGSKTSRKIIGNLIEKEMTALQISKELGLGLNLVLYHLNKMLKLQIISVAKTTKNSRGHKVKHYRAKKAVMIFSKNTKNKAEKSKMFSDIIKRVTRFSAIGMAGAFTWFVTRIAAQSIEFDTALKYPRPTLPQYMMPMEPQSASMSEFFIPIVLGGIVIVSLLAIDKMIIQRVRNKMK